MSGSASFLKVKKLLQVASGRFAFPYPEHVGFSLFSSTDSNKLHSVLARAEPLGYISHPLAKPCFADKRLLMTPRMLSLSR
jgi:hypothetical protein